MVVAVFQRPTTGGRETCFLKYIPFPAQLSHRRPWATLFFVDGLEEQEAGADLASEHCVVRKMDGGLFSSGCLDCPEKGQASGKQSKHAVVDLAFGKNVTVQMHCYDKYKRTIGDVMLPDGTNLNQEELVKQGWCWSSESMRQGIRYWKG